MSTLKIDTLSLIASLLLVAPASAQERIPVPPDEQIARGVNLMLTPDPRPEQNESLVKKFRGLRVTDVMDAMQAVGLQDVGKMEDTIRPLWQDHKDFTHRVYGVAATARYVPTNKRMPSMPLDKFFDWHADWYANIAPAAISKLAKPGTIFVIDAQGVTNTGFVGSGNALGWKSKGMAGVVTNGPCRDTDEVVVERIPVYSRHIGGGTRPGRIEVESFNRPVVVGGALVIPGDFIIADGDGVQVVPRAVAEKVAEISWQIAKKDKQGRGKLYEKLGMKPDSTVK